jgi:DNA ligase D-like protein (predicted ligase)
MLAQAATVLPEGPEWSYEPKWDGYRAIAEKKNARVRIYSRNHNDLTRQYPSVAAAINRLAPAQLVLDGEIVALDARGRPSFQALQHRASTPLTIAYYLFDLLSVGGRDLTILPLEARRVELRRLKLVQPLLLSDGLPGTTEQIVRAIKQFGLEGIVAKRRDSIYRPGKRSESWVKVRFGNRQEFVVGGFRPAGATFDALIAGYFERGQLLYVAKIRVGFTPAVKRTLLETLQPLVVRRCPFANLPMVERGRWGEGLTAEDMESIQWTKPKVVVEVEFVEWTASGALRHPKFIGVRTDKAPKDVHRG